MRWVKTPTNKPEQSEAARSHRYAARRNLLRRLRPLLNKLQREAEQNAFRNHYG